LITEALTLMQPSTPIASKNREGFLSVIVSFWANVHDALPGRTNI